MCWKAAGAEEAAEDGGEALGSVILGSSHENQNARAREQIKKFERVLKMKHV